MPRKSITYRIFFLINTTVADAPPGFDVFVLIKPLPFWGGREYVQVGQSSRFFFIEDTERIKKINRICRYESYDFFLIIR